MLLLLVYYPREDDRWGGASDHVLPPEEHPGSDGLRGGGHIITIVIVSYSNSDNSNSNSDSSNHRNDNKSCSTATCSVQFCALPSESQHKRPVHRARDTASRCSLRIVMHRIVSTWVSLVCVAATMCQ